MRKLLFTMIGAAVMLAACDTRLMENCPPDQRFGEWGVLNKSVTFGIEDSTYFIINPVGEVYDSLFYNADYTDSYYKSDSTRITLLYTLNDTVKLNVDRLYAVETNPNELYMQIKAIGDTTRLRPCEFKFIKKESTDKIYYMTEGKKELTEFLLTGLPLKIFATNFPRSYEENPNSQNYSMIFYTEGFEEALRLCYELNHIAYPDSLNPKDEKKDHRRREKHKK